MGCIDRYLPATDRYGVILCTLGAHPATGQLGAEPRVLGVKRANLLTAGALEGGPLPSPYDVLEHHLGEEALDALEDNTDSPWWFFPG